MESGLTALALAAAFFVGGHFLVSSTGLRPILIGVLGERRYLGLYSLVAILLFLWLLLSYVTAPYVTLWEAPGWAAWLPIIVMPFTLLLLVAGLTQPNPTAVAMPGGAGEAQRRAAASPQGILAITRHPMLWAFGLWGLSHAPANGDAASLILFGSMAVLALGGTIAIDARKRRNAGADWERLAAATSNLPFAALCAGRARIALGEIGWWRPALALVLYALLLALHPLVIGVPALPG